MKLVTVQLTIAEDRYFDQYGPSYEDVQRELERKLAGSMLEYRGIITIGEVPQEHRRRKLDTVAA